MGPWTFQRPWKRGDRCYNVIASKKMLNAAGVELVRLGKRVRLNVEVISD